MPSRVGNHRQRGGFAGFRVQVAVEVPARGQQVPRHIEPAAASDTALLDVMHVGRMALRDCPAAQLAATATSEIVQKILIGNDPRVLLSLVTVRRLLLPRSAPPLEALRNGHRHSDKLCARFWGSCSASCHHRRQQDKRNRRSPL
jgi:hypothetical protein